MFNGEGDLKEPRAYFEKVLKKSLAVTTGIKNVFPVYSYFNASLHKTHFIYYAPVSQLREYKSGTGGNLAWFNFKQITKLSLSSQAKHDIVVAGRVIAAQARADEPRVGIEPTT